MSLRDDPIACGAEPPLAWMPIDVDGFTSDFEGEEASTARRDWMLRTAGSIDGAAASLPRTDELRARGFVTAAVYVEGARRSLSIASKSLRLVSALPHVQPLDDDGMDPLLAEWLH